MKDMIKQMGLVRKNLTSVLKAAEARSKKADLALEAAKKEQEAACVSLGQVRAQAQKVEECCQSMVGGSLPEVKRTRSPKTVEEKPVQKRRGRKPGKVKEAKPEGKRTSKGQDIPTFAAAIIKVMGSNTMKASEVTEAVKSEGNAPKSNNLKLYVANVLNSAKAKGGQKIFEKVGRGQFKVATWAKKGLVDEKASEPKEEVTKKHPGRPKGKVTEDRPKGVRGRPKGSVNKAKATQESSSSEEEPTKAIEEEKTPTADDILKELGTNVEALGDFEGTEKSEEEPLV